MAKAGDPRLDDSTETELRPSSEEATLTSAPGSPATGSPPTGSPAAGEPVTYVPPSSVSALPDLGLTPVPRELYLVEGEIARGGMGRVLAARDRRLGRPVALKELLSTSPELARRFEREALMTARLQHPSIVNVHEAGRWPSGEPFFAMKRVVGKPLDAVVREAATLEDRLALLPKVLAIAEAMAYAHEQGVIHRDLKPANVLVGAFGETVVVDWGLAKDLLREGGFEEEGQGREVESSDGLTVVGTVMGTPAYMAPEQARGERVDERADVYALGAILYTVLAGSAPYVGPSSTAVLEEVLKGPPVPLEQRQGGLPEDLLALVRKAMAAAKGARYRTAREFAEDLRRYQTGQLVGAHRYSTGQLLRRWVRKHRATVAVAAAAVLALGLGGIVAFRRVQEERDVAQRERAEAAARNDELVLSQARGALESDPTASLAWLKHYSKAGPLWGAVRIIAADALSRRAASLVLDGHQAQLEAVAFSPDGRRLASVGIDWAVWLWDLTSGQGRELGRARWHVHSVAFSPDGRMVAIGEGLGRVGLWDTETGKGELIEGLEAAHEGLAFSADGRDILLIGTEVARWRIAERSFVYRVGREEDRIGRTGFISPDRRWAVTNDAGRVRVWDVDTGVGRDVIRQKVPTRLGMAFCGNGDSLAVWTGDQLDIVDLRTPGHPRRPMPSRAAKVRSLACSADGHWAAVGDEDWKIHLWNLQTSERRLLVGHHGPVEWMVFSPDGTRLATEDDTPRLLLWDLATGASEPLRGLQWVSPLTMKFSPDGTSFVAADRRIRLWRLSRDWATDIPARELADDYLVELSPDGRLAATGGEGPGVRLWDIAGGTVRTLSGPSLPPPAADGRSRAAVRSLAWSSDSRTLAAGGDDGIVHLWDLVHGRHHPVPAEAGALSSVALSPDGRRLAVGTKRGLALRDVGGGAWKRLAGHTNPIGTIEFSPDGQWLTTASIHWIAKDRSKKVDSVVNVWNFTTGERRTLVGHEDTVFDATFSPDGRSIASGSLDHTIRHWDLETGTSRVLRGHGDLVETVQFSPDGRRLVSTSNDQTIRMWDLTSGSSQAIPVGGDGRLRFSADGERLCGAVRIWDVASLEGRALLPATGRRTRGSPDCSVLVGLTERGDLRVWRDDLPLDQEGLRAELARATNLVMSPRSGAEGR